MSAPSPGDTITPQAASQHPAAALDPRDVVSTQTSGRVRAMAERLTKRGLTVRTKADEDSQLLKVTGAGTAACDLVITDGQYFACDYIPRPSPTTSPAGVARTVARMLATDYTSPQRYAHLHQGVALAGAVGRDMKARGMSVTLSIGKDDETFTVFAAIVITNPTHPERGTVLLDDSGWLYWECYGDEVPGGPADLADTVADVLTAGRARPSPHARRRAEEEESDEKGRGGTS
jgi:hypothetical protein